MFTRIQSILPRWLAAAVFALGLAACGGSGSSMSGGTSTGPQGCTSSTCGNAVMTLTDAPGDFASYTVNVTSLQLTKADGTVVETLGSPTAVDFAQLVDVTELVSAAAIPQGEYVAVTMTLDYSGGGIYVYNSSTDTSATAQAEVQTQVTSGTPPTTTTETLFTPPSTPGSPSTVTVQVQLDSAHHFFINPGKLSRLALDFNLAASNTVDLTNPALPIVTVGGTLVATVAPSDTKSIRVRGTLTGVNTANNSYTVNVEPFNDQSTNRGTVTVYTTPTTTFQIDGTAYVGDTAGIPALAAALANDPTTPMAVAFGTLSTTDNTFTATEVLAGSSVQSSKLDRIQGVVTAEPACPSGTASGVVCLAVSGGTIQSHADGACRFSPRNVTVEISSSTALSSAAGNPTATLTMASVSIGSEITAFGTAGAGTDANGNPIFDASSSGDALRLEVTSLWGIPTASGIGANQVTINLQTIEGLPASAFTFSPTTTSVPSAYVVKTGILPLPSLTASTPAALRFFGFVQPIGQTPPDFNAVTLVNFTNTSAALDAAFGSGSTAALTSNTNCAAPATGTATCLVLNVSDPLLVPMSFIKIGPQLIKLATLGSNVEIDPSSTSNGPFAIRGNGASPMNVVDVFNNFADFETMLGTKLTGGAKVEKVYAIGQYDQSSNSLTAQQIMILLD